MDRYKINFYTSFSHLKASICERANKTIKIKLYKYFSYHGTTNWISVLQAIIDEYNNTKHRTIGISPNQVDKENEKFILDHVYRFKPHYKKPKFKVGDSVRISRYKKIFDKSYRPQWTTEVFKVSEVRHTSPRTYNIRDLDGNEIEGSFYEQEISICKEPDVYLVEKILKEKNGKAFVKFIGFKDPEWIDKSNIID